MTTDQLRAMFLAQDAWDRQEQDKDVIVRLVEAIAVLNAEIAKLNELLKE